MIPNVKELQSLADYGEHDPALPSGLTFNFNDAPVPPLHWNCRSSLSPVFLEERIERIKGTRIARQDTEGSKRMLIKVQGKGGKQRYTILSKKLLKELRRYYKHVQPKTRLEGAASCASPSHCPGI
jgi:hypothetical protein